MLCLAGMKLLHIFKVKFHFAYEISEISVLEIDVLTIFFVKKLIFDTQGKCQNILREFNFLDSISSKNYHFDIF